MILNNTSSSGVTGLHASKKFGFPKTTTDVETLFNDDSANVLVIATQHNTHADLIIKGIEKNIPVYCEKPMCINKEELEAIKKVYNSQINSGEKPPVLMVGFNRRFAPHIVKMKQLLSGVKAPKSVVITINAGRISSDHWVHDLDVGGGRIIGEVCHFVDLVRFLIGHRIVSFSKMSMSEKNNDTLSINFSFSDGSIATVNYFANGSKSYSKERVEVFSGGRILLLDNFRRLTGYGWDKFSKMRLWRQDKGQKASVQAFIDSIKDNKISPIPFEELCEVSSVTLELS